MKKLALVALAVLAVSAWGADTILSPPYHGTNTAPAPVGGPDASYTLSWDSGSITNAVAWYTGANSWAAVDFSIATITSYNNITSGMIYYYPNWPNSTCEGNRMAVYAFSGGAVGSMLWGPTYVRGTATGSWQTFNVGWSLGSTTTFALAFDQYYNYPSCDPCVNMMSSGTASHSWYNYGPGSTGWRAISSLGYGNYPLAIRVVVSDNVGIAPSSVGRVKALYY